MFIFIESWLILNFKKLILSTYLWSVYVGTQNNTLWRNTWDIKKRRRRSREHKNEEEEAKKKEKLPVVRRWIPSRNQRRVGDCCHRIISFNKNRLKRKKVCSFQYRPALIYRLKFNETCQNGQNKPEWTEIQFEVELGGDSYRLSD